jgi:steroid 5-alpha reductase family enzyme
MIATLAVTAALFFAVWLLSLVRRDASIVDVFWGVGFVAVALSTWTFERGYEPRATLVLGLVALWGLRLAGHLLLRNRGQPEDPRYQAMRRAHGARFAWVSLYTVFGLQAALLWIVSLPAQVAITAAVPAWLGPLDAIGSALFAIGFLFEAVGDLQLARFRADPANRGRVLQRGLWAWTRHPNYFGDALVWWGIFAIALGVPWGWATLPAPALMTLLLLRVSGVALLERSIAKRRPEYEQYRERTSAFLPWPPRRDR